MVPPTRPTAYDRGVTVGVLTGPSSNGPSGTGEETDSTDQDWTLPDAGQPTVPEIVRRRLTRWQDSNPYSWLAIGLVTLIAGALRLLNLGFPKDKIFDEVYYPTEAHTLLGHLVEWDTKADGGIETEMTTPKYVVHPPLGKWCIAIGEKIFGYNAFGWRISAAVFGIASILIIILVTRRLFRSTLLGCVVGLLVSLDGMHFVMSRTGLLDIFLMAFLIAAFACLVMDREHRRAKWLEALEAGFDPARRGASPALGFPWWRLGAAVLTGCAASVKWSAIWYMIAFMIMIYLWEVGLRRTVGSPVPWSDALVTQLGWMVGFCAIVVGVYLASWWGWFATDEGYFRHWLRDSGKTELPVIGALQNLWHYHQEAFKFHTHLSSYHQYQSWPWQWLLLGRPVAFYWSNAGPCDGSSCAAEIVLLGTPVLWWSFIPALIGMTWIGISKRDWRAAAIGIGAAAGIVPWFWNELDSRTMFYFYALPAEPFLVMAVVYVLGAIIGPSPKHGGSKDRRLIGLSIATAYVVIVAACFAYFYPIYTGTNLSYVEWYARMWLGGRWI